MKLRLGTLAGLTAFHGPAPYMFASQIFIFDHWQFAFSAWRQLAPIGTYRVQINKFGALMSLEIDIRCCVLKTSIEQAA